MPKVLNKRTLPGTLPINAVFVARPSKWGNPFRIGKDGSRQEVITKYRAYLDFMMAQGELDPRELRGLDLICHCAPLPCHADILLEIANREGA